MNAGAETKPITISKRPVTRAEITAWALCDWANSAYSTLSITLLVFYLEDFVLPDEKAIQVWGTTINGSRVWGWGLGCSMLCAAWLSPILGAMADARASKWKWLIGTSLPGAMFATAIALMPSSQPLVIVALFFFTSLCFELSFGFYNGFLPELADDESMNRLSGIGFAAGYLGGGLALLLSLGVAYSGAGLGLSKEACLQAGLIVMGLWWGLFTLPAAFLLRDRAVPRSDMLDFGSTALVALREVWHTLQNVRRFSVLSLFLLGFLVYNEGIQTVMSQASVFAKRPPLLMTSNDLILVVLMIQFVAFPAALGVGWISDRIGPKVTLLVCLLVWCGLLIAGYFVQSKTQFWIMGTVLALVMGGTQSVSRAMMGAMTPQAKTAEFFGFFNLSCRATSMVGPILFVEVLNRTGKANLAILSLLGFIVVGMVIISFVNLTRGMLQAKQG